MYQWFMAEFLSQILHFVEGFHERHNVSNDFGIPCKHRHFDITSFSSNSFNLSCKLFYKMIEHAVSSWKSLTRIYDREIVSKVKGALWHFTGVTVRSRDNTRLLHVDWLKPMSRSKKASTAFTGISFPATAAAVSSLGPTLVPHLRRNTSWCCVLFSISFFADLLCRREIVVLWIAGKLRQDSGQSPREDGRLLFLWWILCWII